MTDLRAAVDKIILECPKEGPKAQVFLESILREVEEEARQDGIKTERASNSGATKTAVGYVVGWEAALEQAAKIAEEHAKDLTNDPASRYLKTFHKKQQTEFGR